MVRLRSSTARDMTVLRLRCPRCACGHGARRRKVETSTLLRRAAAGRYVETVGSPSTQNRQGRSAALRRPTRGPVRDARRGCPGRGEGQRTGREVGAVVRRGRCPSAWQSRAGPRARSRSVLPRRRRAVPSPSTTSPARSSTADAVALGADHHVAAVVHAVGEVDVEVAGRAEHHLRCGRVSPFDGVRARVTRSVVRLDLGDAATATSPCRSTAPSSRGATSRTSPVSASGQPGTVVRDGGRSSSSCSATRTWRGAAAGVARGDRPLDGEHLADAGREVCVDRRRAARR